MQGTVKIDEKQLEMLESLNRFRKDDFKHDPLDEQFLTNIFKLGLLATMRFYGKAYTKPDLIEKANQYMVSGLLGSDFTVDDLLNMWEEEDQ